MHINTTRRADIGLSESEIDMMCEILRLAYRQLHSHPATALSGSPLSRQAGLCGPELIMVKTMIEQLGHAMGASLPYEPITDSHEPTFSWPLATRT